MSQCEESLEGVNDGSDFFFVYCPANVTMPPF